jgi:uncharacterized delta-60 repeat protein
MTRTFPLLCLFLLAPVLAPAADGVVDPAFGDDGRTSIGYLESTMPRLRAIVRRPAGGSWLFSDNTTDPAALYSARLLSNGQPDPAYNGNGRRRTALPANLIPQAEALSISGALVQADGKPLVYGALYGVDGSPGPYPALICRLTAAGSLDAGFGTGGCFLMRSLLTATESCRVDAAAPLDNTFILIGNCHDVGDANTPPTPSRPFITRITAAGAFDFGYGGGAAFLTPLVPDLDPTRQSFHALAIDPFDGAALVLAQVDRSDNGVPNTDIAVLRFDGGGSFDADFGNNGVVLVNFDVGHDKADLARSLALDEARRILVLGQTLTGEPKRAAMLLARLLPGGTLDASFGTDGRRIDDRARSLGVSTQFDVLAIDPRSRPVIGGRRSLAGSAPDHAGTHFWLAVPRTIAPEQPPSLLISGGTAIRGVVRHAESGLTLPFETVAGGVTRIDLRIQTYLSLPNDIVATEALEISAEAPISVSLVHGRQFVRDGFIALPTSTLGFDHRVAAWGVGTGPGAVIIVVATRDDTSVIIEPSAALPNRPAGVPYEIVMQRGQTYRVTSIHDLSGSRVTSDKPVAVITGHSCARVPTNTDEICDGAFAEQLPVDRWGTSFHVVPTPGRTQSDMVRVYAHQAGTEVRLDGIVVGTLAAGNTLTFALGNGPRAISTSKPAAVAQLAASCDNGCIGGVHMVMVTPRSQWRHRLVAMVLERDPSPRYDLVIVSPASAIGTVKVNGVPVPPASFTQVGSSDVMRAYVSTQPGLQRITAGQPVAAYVVIQSLLESIAFPAAADPSGDGLDTDDFMLRFRADGSRDPGFGIDGAVAIDHGTAFGSPTPSLDSVRGLLVDSSSIIVGTDAINTNSDQSLPTAYRIKAAGVFRDGFE